VSELATQSKLNIPHPPIQQSIGFDCFLTEDMLDNGGFGLIILPSTSQSANFIRSVFVRLIYWQRHTILDVKLDRFLYLPAAYSNKRSEAAPM
jgi:hypothetical protein